MDLSALIDLPVLPARIHARARDPLFLPRFSASSLRGAFGTHLKRLVCARPAGRNTDSCEGCPHNDPHDESCAYSYLFETRAPVDTAGTVGFEDLPRPYVIRCAAGGERLATGESFAWDVSLIGRAIGFLPYLLMAWSAGGEGGLGAGQGRYEVAAAESLGLDGQPRERLYDRESNRLRPPGPIITPEEVSASLPSSLPADTIRIRFLSPTRLKHRKEFASRPEFHVLWRVLQRRLSLLRLAHGGGRPEIDFAATIRLAESVRLERWESSEVRWERYSNRQEKRVPMGGFVGEAVYAGDLAPFLPALRLGTVVGVGDNCTFGQGAYEIRLDGLSTEERTVR